MKANLFIIGTPFQLINALEAKQRFPSAINILVLTINHSGGINQKISSILKQENWGEEYIFPINTYQKGANSQYIKTLKLIKNKFKIVNLFIGHFKIFNQQIAFYYLKPDKFFLLDDGVATTTTQTLYLSQSKMDYDAPLLPLIKKYIKFLIRGIVCSFPYDLYKYTNLFTSYRFLKPHSQKQEVLYHSFEYFLSIYKSSTTPTTSNTIYFIGQPCGQFCTDEKEYIALFENIKSFLCKSNYHIIYIAHTLDSKEFLDKLSQSQWEVQNLDQIIEIHLLTQKIKPIKIISFISSALFNLALLFPDTEIESIDIRPLIKEKFLPSANVVYESLQQIGIKRIALDLITNN